MPHTTTQQVLGSGHSHPDVFLAMFAETDDDSRALSGAMLAAVVLHVALLMVTFPSFKATVVEAADPPKVVRLAPTPRMRRVEPPVTRTPRKVQPSIVVPDLLVDDTILMAFNDVPVIFDTDLPELGLAIPSAPPSNIRPTVMEDTAPIRVSADFVRPNNIHYVEPEYPLMAKRVRREGNVVIRTVIGHDGSIVFAEIEKGLPLGLSEAALRAVKQWRFEPPTWDGRPVELNYVVTVQFKLS